MNMKKILSLTLCTALLASLAVSCAKAPVSSAPPAAGSTGSAPVSNEAYFPLKEQKTIKIVGVRDDTGVPFAETQYFKDLEKQTNVKVEWIDWPQSMQKEKQNLLFSGGQLPDAFYGSWVFSTKEDVLRYGSEGSLKDMKEYFTPEIMPNFTQLTKDVPDLLSSITSAEGNVYSLVSYDFNTISYTNDILAINSKWLEAVKMEVPTTIDELEAVLKAFKAAGDLNGNGKADEMPMSFLYNDGNNGLFGLMGFTGIPIANKNSRMVMKNGAPAFHPETDEYKEYLTYLNKLSSQGLLDPEAFTMDPATYNAKVQTATPSVGVVSTWSIEGLNKPADGDKWDTSKDGTYVLVPPLKGKDGVKPVWSARVSPLTANLCFGISAKSENAELVARWIDLAFDPQTSFHNSVGIEGVNVKSEGDNKYSRIKKEDGKDFAAGDMYPLIPFKFSVSFNQKDAYEFIDKAASVQNKAYCDSFYKDYLYTDRVNEYGYSKLEESTRLSELMPDLFAYVDQMSAQFITKGGIAEGWDKYLSQLKSLHSDEYLKIKTDIHNRNK